ncbi:mechanosensitive ion channel family protein [Qipengyuania marisflavi]|uniref:Small-conductance mechanosensitive channel n=1 Tax=Qipengyuania marisflavi TaxID=2486356 RepID=A0A5S3PB21_9SPHN|nr:mechanosensitive ion channel family protein [Qipengyuania marisflavi]TMM49955.1 mechanosensitive ion channel family protein [Qipengyuania marisflavi]
MDYIETLRKQLQAMAEGFVASLPSFAIALLILFVTWILARFATRIADALVGRTEVRASLRNLMDTLVNLAIWVMGLMIAAIVVFPDLTAASLLAGLGLGAVAIGFAFQDIFENFFAGVLIMVRTKMRIGDVIVCEGISGKVEHISLRETHVRKLSGELTLVPNSMLFKNPVEILTDESERRHEVVVGVSYDTNLDHAADVIRRAVEGLDVVLASKGVDIFAQEFNSSSVDFLVRWWAGSSPRDAWETKDKVIRAIKAALDDAGIEIPFPYVTHTFKETVPVTQLDGNRRGFAER